jgi:hypothetical protein
MTCHTEGGGVAHVLLLRATDGWSVEGDANVHGSVAELLKNQPAVRFPPTEDVKAAFKRKWPSPAEPEPLHATRPYPAPKTTAHGHARAHTDTAASAATGAEYSEPNLNDPDDSYETADRYQYDDVDEVAKRETAAITVRSPLGNVTLRCGDLVLGEVLGRGAFGTVRKAILGDQQVAVKQVLVSGNMTQEQREKAVSDFDNEAKRMAAVPPHRNIVQMIGALELDSGELVLVTELCNGGSLVNKLYGSGVVCKFTSDELLAIARDCAAGMAHLHFHSCVHRDVAARNVLLYCVRGGAFVGKIADFGMARELGRDSVDEKVTKTRTVPVRWMAPETVSAEREIVYSFRTDVFAFGAMLYEIFAQRMPYDNVKRNDAIMLMIANAEPLKLPDVGAGGLAPPHGLADVLCQCREAEPEQRPTMRAVCASLTQLLTVK